MGVDRLLLGSSARLSGFESEWRHNLFSFSKRSVYTIKKEIPPVSFRFRKKP